MWKKVLPNVLYNIGLFLCLIFGYQFILQRQYGFLIGALLFIAIFIVLKIRLYKEIKGAKKP
ncbi:MAG: hypothetical protein JWQ63_1372 [Mucilaginibacter sp.]|jgi:hypothetical protein|nr:hypothetical protein [Mucilaginibacter sp.]